VTSFFTASQRVLRLELGEAIFQVAPERNRPFIVQTGQQSIMDVGTKFDLLVTELDTQITVLDGAVKIVPLALAAQPDSIAFGPEQQIDIVNDQPTVKYVKHVASADIQRMTAWTSGYVQLDNRTLGEVLAEFQRYEHVAFSIKDPEILKLKFGGTFATSNLNGFLDSISVACVRYSSSRKAPDQRLITLTRSPGKRKGNVCR
jgi:transmembrane sensor